MNDYFNHDNPLTRHTLGRAEQVNGIFQAVEAGFDKLPEPSEIYEGRTTYVVDSGTANAYAVDLPHAPEAYTEGMSFTMKAANANTGASTVNVNELGVIPIRRFDGTDLMPGDIIAGMLVQIAYDGTVFRIIGTHGGEVSLARAWASRTSGPVADGLFSAREYAAGNQAGTGGSAKNWAQQAGGVTGAGAGDRSAKSWAQEELVTGTLGGSAKDWAQYTGGSISGQGWSAKAFAQSEGLLSTGSAKEWATKLTEVSGGLKGARGYAQDASASASAASSSASNALGSANAAAGSAQDALTHYNTFRGIYYGALADDPATDPNGDPTTAGDIYFNSVSSRARIYNGSAWQDLGLNSLGDGSAASPGLAFLNDPDTGIFRPGNDTFAIATGGAERVRVTSAGNVGVGITNPDIRLVVADTSNPVQMRVGTNIDGIAAPRLRFSGRSGSTARHADLELDAAAGRFSIFAPATGTAPTVRAINITANTGNVGIGNTSPAYKLVVSGTEDDEIVFNAGVKGEDGVGLYVSANDTNRTVGLFASGRTSDVSMVFGTGVTERMRLTGTGHLLLGGGTLSTIGTNITTFQITGGVNDRTGGVRLESADGSLIGGIYGIANTINVAVNSNHPLVFRTSNVERARFDAGGTFMIGKTVSDSTSAGIELRQSGELIINRSTPGLYLGRFNDGQVAHFRHDGSTVGSIAVTASATAYNTTSDYRLKENVVPLTGALDRICQIPVYRFNFINDPERTVDGFFAHQVQAVVAEAVTGEKDEMEDVGEITDAEGNVIEEGVPEPTDLPEGHTWTKTGTRPVYQGIDQSKLVPLLTAAVQELVARVEALEAA